MIAIRDHAPARRVSDSPSRSKFEGRTLRNEQAQIVEYRCVLLDSATRRKIQAPRAPASLQEADLGGVHGRLATILRV